MSQDATQVERDLSAVGVIFHTALRKAVDSTVSVASWNHYDAVPDAVRSSFATHLAKSLETMAFTAKALRHAALSWAEEARWSEKLRRHEKDILILGALLKLHSNDDWTAIAQFMRACGIAPKADWELDDESHWIEGAGIVLELNVKDNQGNVIGTAETRLRTRDGKQLAPWNGYCSSASDDLVEGFASIVEKARSTVLDARDDWMEARARPDAGRVFEGFDLVRPIDMEDAIDRFLVEQVGQTPVVLMRRPTRNEGRDAMMFHLAIPDDAGKGGYLFRWATVEMDLDAPKPFASWKSSVQRWLEGDGIDQPKKLGAGVDDDLLDVVMHVSLTDDVLTIENTARRRGREFENLCSGRISLPLRFEVDPTPSA